MNPENVSTTCDAHYVHDTLALPKDGWNTLSLEEGGKDIPFTHGHMVAYFVSRRPG